jgi:hypothetical protein
MVGGKKAIVATAALAACGCTADDGKLNVRAIADPLSAAAKRGSPMLAEGRTALALGNVGTALEAFRRALREQPESIEALAGIAACYERMGRYDLSRVNYEAALAIAPNNPILLNSFAASLQQQGRHAEARALRAEAEQAEAVEVASAVRSAQAEIAPVARPMPPAATTATVPSPVKLVALAPAAAAPMAQPTSKAPEPTPVTHTEVVGNTEWTIEIPQEAQLAGSVTVALPPAQLAELAPITPTPEVAPVAAPVAAPVPRPAPVAVALREPPQPNAPASPSPKNEKPALPVVLAEPRLQGAQPRLQRLSMGEVALLTRGEPAWRTEVTARTQHSVTARFVPLKGAAGANQGPRFVPLRTAMAANRPNVRLLNAARRQGLAARTRETLLDRGWRKIAIGDAAQVRARSIVLYPANREALGKRVAAQFGFASAVNHQSDDVLVLLGHDAASLSFRRTRT